MQRTFSEQWEETEGEFRVLIGELVEQLHDAGLVGRLLARLVRLEERRTVKRYRKRVLRHIPWFPFRD